ncbi:hypothetical protein B0A48_15988 [Cryoendolithus antarcticus]|uniref:Uncharacterized protein n=1 Tax=Cryoendolithus antarcticus TaxID=1507870 RepID=A0A1V8SGA0_9PEZI|nr:hypothetical protein B0A48_15988 [Cryoendolithus antarcticus]
MADLPHLADVEDIYNLYDENRLEGFVHQAEEVLDEAIDVSRYHQVHLLLMLENCAADTFDMSEYLQRAERVYAIMVAYEDRTDPEVEPALEDLQQRIQRIQRNIDQKPWGALQKLGGGAGELAGAGIGDDTGLSRSYDGAADDDAMDTVPELGGDGAADERDDSAVTTRAADINTAAPPINANEEVAAVAPDSSIMTSGEAESSSVVASPTEEPAQEPKVSAPGPTRTPGPVAHALRKKPSIVAAQF